MTDEQPPLVLSCLGYGNMAALVNDARGPTAATAAAPAAQGLPEAGMTASPAKQLAAGGAVNNCALLPVCVRGLVLPVLVACRDMPPGQQLLREYGEGWWAGAGPAMALVEGRGVSMQALVYG